VCIPRRPVCEYCPVAAYCLAYERGTQTQRPVKKAKAPLQTVRVAAAIIRDTSGRYLLIQRPPEGLFGGLWMFPGGHCENEESYTACLQRVLPATLGINVHPGLEMATAAQDLTHLRMNVRALACELQSGADEIKSLNAIAWAAPSDFHRYAMAKADRDIARALAQWQPRLFEE
ncbi:MAG: NUDIX domain-containing protein, partial [Blastocatellia bacterium]